MQPEKGIMAQRSTGTGWQAESELESRCANLVPFQISKSMCLTCTSTSLPQSFKILAKAWHSIQISTLLIYKVVPADLRRGLRFSTIHRTPQLPPYKYAKEVTDAWQHVNSENLRYSTDHCSSMTVVFYFSIIVWEGQDWALGHIKARPALHCTAAVTTSHGQWGPRLRLWITDIGPTSHVPADHTTWTRKFA